MAITQIPSEFISTNAISGTIIADNAITAVHIATNAVSGTLIADNAVTAVHIATNAISGTLIADNAVTAVHIAGSSITATQIQDNAIGTGQLAGIARGKIIYGDLSGNPQLLTLGSSGQVLKSDGTDIAWGSISTPITALNNATENELLTVGATTTELEAESGLTWDTTTLTVNGAAVFNESSADVDFRIESADNANMFWVDASTNHICIGSDNQQSILSIDGPDDAITANISSSMAATGAWNGIAFGARNSMKGAILYERTTSYARGRLVIAVENTADTSDAAIADAAMYINNDKSVQVVGALTIPNTSAANVNNESHVLIRNLADGQIVTDSLLYNCAEDKFTVGGGTFITSGYIRSGAADMKFGTASNGVMITLDDSANRIGFGTSTPDVKFDFEDNAASSYGCYIKNTNSSYTGYNKVLNVGSYTGGSVNWSPFQTLSGNGSGFSDIEHHLRGDGNGYCDGSWSGGGADYAEYFEWKDGNPSDEERRGYSVILDGDKVVKATESTTDIIGVVSSNPSMIGNSDMEAWKQKYLRDDYGGYDRDEDGYRKPNPAYDESLTYVRREFRKEWGVIGLMGRCRLTKGEPTNPNWIKLRDISATVEEWLVR